MEFRIGFVPQTIRKGKLKRDKSKRSRRGIMDTREDMMVFLTSEIMREINYSDIKEIRYNKKYNFYLTLKNGEVYLLHPLQPNIQQFGVANQTLSASIGDLQRQTAEFKRMHMLFNIIKSKMEGI